MVAPEACDDGNALDGDGCNSDCQISGSLVWCKTEIGPGTNNVGVAVATDSTGNAIVVGRAHNADLDGDAPIVIKYSGDGSLLWTRTLDDELYAMGVVTRADDSIVVATERRLFALTATGEVTYSGPSNEVFGFQRNGLTISTGGTIGFAANTFGLEPRAVGGALHDGLTVAWSHEVDDLAAKTESWAIAADHAGNWLLGGTVVVETIDQGDAGIREIYAGFLRKYDASGTLLWVQAVPSPDEGHGHHLTAVRPDADNHAVTLGFLTNSGPVDAPNMVITTLSEGGQLIDQITLVGGDIAVYGRDMVLTPAGDRVIAGTKYSEDSSAAYAFVARHTEEGAIQWNYRNALIPARGSGFTAVRENVMGDLFVTGLQLQEKATLAKILVCKIRR